MPSVSRGTLKRLQVFQALLEQWNVRINLVSRNETSDLWNRHIIDSAQIFSHRGNAKTWIDLGSGGGLPGLVCAIIAEETAPEISFTLVEADQRKSIFLSQAAHHLDLTVDVKRCRIEEIPPKQFDIISARALASVPKLLSYSENLTHPDSVLLFLKGKNASHELTEASEDWHIQTEILPSLSDPSGKILKITNVQRRT